MKWSGVWAGVLAGMFFGLFVAPPLAGTVVPMRWFYELRSITVQDTTVGVSPQMVVDRSIHRDFVGRFEVQILEERGAEFVAFWACGPHNSQWRTYRQDARLPGDLNLDWWMDIPPNRECHFPPGKYKILTTVYARTWFNGETSTERASNVFTVRR